MKFARKGFQSETVKELIFRRTLTGYKLDPDKVHAINAKISNGENQAKREVKLIINKLKHNDEIGFFEEIGIKASVIVVSIVVPLCAAMAHGVYSLIPRTRGNDGTRYVGFSPEFFYPGNGINDIIGRELMHKEQMLSMLVGASAPIVLYGAVKLARLIRKEIVDPFFNVFYLRKLDKIFVMREAQEQIRQTTT